MEAELLKWFAARAEATYLLVEALVLLNLMLLAQTFRILKKLKRLEPSLTGLPIVRLSPTAPAPQRLNKRVS